MKKRLCWAVVLTAACCCCTTGSNAGGARKRETRPVVVKVADLQSGIGIAHMIFRDRTTPEIRVLKPGPQADRLAGVWKELSQKKSLPLDGERMTTREGSRVREHYTEMVVPGAENYPYAVYDNLRREFQVELGYILRRMVLERKVEGKKQVIGRLEFHNPTPIAFFRTKQHPAETERLLKVWRTISGEEGSLESDHPDEIELRYSKRAGEPGFFESVKQSLESEHGYQVTCQEEIR